MRRRWWSRVILILFPALILLSACGSGGGDGSGDTTPTEDTTPSQFTFTDQTGVELAAEITSAAVTITGINQPASISISGGEYAVNSGPYTSDSGTVSNNDRVAVRVTSASSFGQTTSVTLTVGGVSDTFDVTTEEEDTTPDAFTFSDQTQVAFNAIVVSDSISITGINSEAPVSITGGEYSVNGGSFTSDDGTITNNSTIEVRLMSGSNFEETTSATVTIGGVSDSFDVTTEREDTTPDDFDIPNQADVPLDTAIESSVVTISGINSSASVTVTGAVYSIDGGDYTSTQGSVTNGQTITLRVTSSSDYQDTVTATLTVDSVSANFAVTTIEDTVNPVATIIFPPFDNSVADTTQIVIRGTSSDNDAMDSVSVNGVTASTTNNFATWQATVNLDTNQTNTITVSATDVNGNTDDAAAMTSVFVKNGSRVCGDFGYDSTSDLLYAISPLSVIDVATNVQTTLVPTSTLTFDAFTYDGGGDRLFGLSGGALYQIDKTNGTTSTVSPQGTDGVSINSTAKLEYDPGADRIYLVDSTDLRVVSIDPDSGSREAISDNTDAGPQYVSNSLLSASDNRLFASTGNFSGVDPAVMEVNITTGDKTVVSDSGTGSGQDFRRIEGFEVDATSGAAYVADFGGDMLQVDLGTGDRAVLSEHDDWINDGLSWEQQLMQNSSVAGNRALIYDCVVDHLLAVDLADGSRSQLTAPYRGAGPTLIFPKHLAFDDRNDRLVTINAGGIQGTGPTSPFSRSRSIIDIAPLSGNRSVIKTDAIGGGDPVGDLVDVDHDTVNDRILVIDADNNALMSINPANGLATTISDNVSKGTGETFAVPTGIAVTADGQSAYVVNSTGDSVLEVDLATGNRTTVSSNGGAGSGPDFETPVDIVLSADESAAYVTNQAGGSIYSVSLPDGTRTDVASSSVGSGTDPVEPTHLSIDTNNRRLFVTDTTLTGVMTIELDSGARSLSNSTGATTTFAEDVAYDTDRDLVFVVQPQPHTVIALDPATYSAVIVSE